MTNLRRFIAGAVCPACGGLDKLFLRTEGGLRVRECVACAFTDALDLETGAPVTPAASADVQPVRLVHD